MQLSVAVSVRASFFAPEGFLWIYQGCASTYGKGEIIFIPSRFVLSMKIE